MSNITLVFVVIILFVQHFTIRRLTRAIAAQKYRVDWTQDRLHDIAKATGVAHMVWEPFVKKDESSDE